MGVILILEKYKNELYGVILLFCPILLYFCLLIFNFFASFY